MKENISLVEEQMDWVDDGVAQAHDDVEAVQQGKQNDVRSQVAQLLRLRNLARVTHSSFDVANYRFAYKDADDAVKAEVDRMK